MKGAPICKSTGEEQATTPALAMTQSVTAPQTAAAAKENDQRRNRKRRNEDSKDFLHGQEHMKQTLVPVHERYEEMKSAPKDDHRGTESAL